MQLTGFLERSTSLISLFVAFNVVIAVVYEYSFFRTFGVSLAQLPSSISDHVKSSVDVYYLSFFVLLFVLLQNFYFKEYVEEKYELISSAGLDVDSYLTKGEVFIKKTMWFFSAFIFVFLILVMTDESYWAIVLGLSVYSLLSALYLRFIVILHSSIGRFNSILLIYFFNSIVFVYFLGMFDSRELKNGQGVRVLYSKLSSNSNLRMVKTFNSHYVFWDMDNQRLIFEKVSDIESLQLVKK